MSKARLIAFATVAACSMIAAGTPAEAALINFTGTISFHNDVVQLGFTLNTDATNVRVWTDSYDNGANFDPITALWDSSGNLIAENDDDASVNPATQTVWDSGFTLPTLSAGDYIFTVASFNNFASGTTLAEGFAFDGDTPIPINDWWVEGDGNWSVWFDGVDSATGPNDGTVPEPASFVMYGVGLAMLAFARKRRGAFLPFYVDK